MANGNITLCHSPFCHSQNVDFRVMSVKKIASTHVGGLFLSAAAHQALCVTVPFYECTSVSLDDARNGFLQLSPETIAEDSKEHRITHITYTGGSGDG